MPPPRGENVLEVVRWVENELRRLQTAVAELEATTINYGKAYVNIATGSALTISWRNGQKQTVALGASCTLTFDPPLGVCNLMLKITYSGSYTPTLPSAVKWQGGTVPTWSAANGKTDVIAMYFDGTNYHATASLDSK
jgi:hypothetical protein